jgi:dihydrofolate synthase / folylpolyglutamate synthase
MDYPEVLKYLYEQLPMFQRIGASALKKNLDNTLALCSALGNPQEKFQSVHIGGTNGKGSSSHIIAACLQCAGYKTGLYTSPHLKEFTERIRIDGKEIPKDAVVNFVLEHKTLIEAIRPSFFEMTVAMAFDHFAREKVDVAVIEVGLGGRLDSTNVINPLCCLITNIGYDHQALLGETLPEIAFEKAGIVKPFTPVVISQTQEEVKSVFVDKASSVNAPLFFADEEYSVTSAPGQGHELLLDAYKDGHPIFSELKSGLKGLYQLKNLPGVLKTIEVVNSTNFFVDDKALRQGISDVIELTGLKGRWQKLADNPLIICDTGHNEDGIKEVVQQIERTSHRNLFFVLGTVKDKDVNKILSLLPENATYFFCEANIPRALSAEELLRSALELGLKGKAIKNVNAAIAEAKSLATKEDLIFVGGSNFIVAEIENL